LTRYDVCVIGGGLIGLAVATAVRQSFDGGSILILEKEDAVATHQSGRNSGVVHSGLYYQPGSLKARLCVAGRRAMYALSEEAGVAHHQSGKLVIATKQSEIPMLAELERRGRANGLQGLRRLSPDEIREIEPAAAGVDALHVPEAGVVDFPAIATHLTATLISGGARIVTSAEVTEISHQADGATVTAGDQRFSTRLLINCAGLHSDRIASMAGLSPKVRIIPFRGEYYQMTEKAAGLIKTLIYPVPDPRFPFLGVHFTRRIDGTVEVGPNAVLALGREHYRDVKPDWSEVRSMFGDAGFRRLAMKHWRSGTGEMINSRSARLYARLARRLVPAVQSGDLAPGGVGIRAQAIDSRGSLIDDFVIETAGSSVHVLNAPSPGATACIAIGRYIADHVGPLLAR